MWFILLFPAAVHAIAFASPQATLLSDKKYIDSLRLPEPTAGPFIREKRDDLVRRATTSAADASVCGFYDGSKNSLLVCYSGNACVFHASNTQFPGLVGCCPTTSTTAPCTIFSTCYNSAEIASSPALLSHTTDPFVMLCTYDEEKYCHTRTWPDLNVADYACTDEGGASSSVRIERMYTAGSLTDLDGDDEDQITATVSVSWIGDAVLLSLKSVAASATSASDSEASSVSSDSMKGASSTVVSGTGASVTGPSITADGEVSEQTSSSTSSTESEGGSGGTSTGTIVGAVVGSVLGLILILAAGWFIWRRRKNASASAPASGPRADSPSALVYKGEVYAGAPHELQAVDSRGMHELMPNREYAELPSREVRHELE